MNRPDCFARGLRVLRNSPCVSCAFYKRCCRQTTLDNTVVGVLRYPRLVKEKPLAAIDAQPLVSKFDEETLADVRTLMTALGFVERKAYRWVYLPDGRKPVSAIQFYRVNRSGIKAETIFLNPFEVERLDGVSRVRWMNEKTNLGARFVTTGVRSFQHVAALLARNLR